MAKKRLKIHNKQGQEEAFDISVENVTLDSEGKTLGTKLAELEHDIEESGDGTYSKPPGGIPASDLAGDIPKDKLSQSVQASLGKADTALQQETDPTVPAWAKASSPPAQVRSDWNQTNPNVASFIVNKPELAPVATSGDYNDLRNKPAIPEGADLSGLFANVSYNSTLKQISFLDKGNNVVGTLDASPFVRDGMVSGVSLTNGVLTITFNTDSGKTPIEITLGDLFNTDNYYTKTDADGKFVVKVSGKGLSTNDYTDADQAKLQNLPTADGLTQQLNSKANASDVVKSISVNGQSQSKDTNGNVNIQVEAGAQGNKGDKGDTVVLNPQGLPQFNIVNDVTTGGASDALSAEMGRRLAMETGTFAKAWARSKAIPFPFCFLWVETVDGESICKPIWHKGNSVFVDAAGSIVNVDAAAVPDAPTITGATGGAEVPKNTQITITPASGSALYYSLDGGTTYNVSDAAVTVALTNAGSVSIVAYCANNKGNSSNATLNVTVAGTAVPVFSPSQGEVARGGYVTISVPSGGELHYKVGSGSWQTASGTSASVQITGNTTIQAYNIQDGDTSNTVTGEFTMAALAAPVFNPASGTELPIGGGEVELSASAGATIYYTTDGSTPTTSSTQYNGTAIQVTEAMTIKAIAVDTYGSSAVAETSYTIKEDEMIIDTTDATATVTLKYNDTNSEKQTVTLNLDSTTTAEGGGYRNTIAINQTNFPNLNANKQFSSIAFSDKNKIKRFYGGGGKYAFAPSQLNSCTSIALIDADITNSSGYRSFYGIGSVNGVVNLILRGSVDGINDFIRGGSTTVSFTVDFSGVTTPSGGFNVPGYLITDCAGSTLTINDGFKVGSGNYKLKILNSAKLSALKIIGSSALDLTENWLGEMLASSSYGYSSSKKLTIKIDNAAKSAYEASSQWSSYLNDEKITWQDLEGNSITWNE